MFQIELTEEELIFVVDGMNLLMKVAEENRRLEEAQVWEELILKHKRAAIPKWLLQLRETQKETGLSL